MNRGTPARDAESRTAPPLAFGLRGLLAFLATAGKELDHRTDLFSFGAVLYEMSTGTLPFRGVIMRWLRGKWHPKEWRPPIQGQSIDWAPCGDCDLREPPGEEEKTPHWADFINRVELAIRWEQLPEPNGELRVHLRSGDAPALRVAFPSLAGPNPSEAVVAQGATSPLCMAVSPEQVRSVLARRVVEISWADTNCRCLFPVNILHDSKAGMPSILGAKPSEEQLLAYFHGHVSEEDLLTSLEQQARESADRGRSANSDDVERTRRLQSYVVREFVESLAKNICNFDCPNHTHPRASRGISLL